MTRAPGRVRTGSGATKVSERRPLDLKKMEEGVRLILEGMRVDVSSSNFADTPVRVARMYAELLTPHNNNFTDFESPTNGMIILRGHRVFAICPHHLLPVELRAYVGYIPKDRVLGLSKLARVVEQQLTRPIMQEELGEATASAIDEQIRPQGVAVVLAGVHGCMRVRGIATTGDVVSSALRGLFVHSSTTRDEFLQLIGRPKA